ncbi:hypothetical protein [uncultured Flavobacterium sp.]|uniref:hypothetical protein n=1 Tax=uncultured Flavobacterium sp. TaxID=165435 RepID=UPI0030EC6482|tara:strand:+ start:44699 stop:45889 length:1191 start_codon:yes stop_codon:yes gene_type:complete
MTFAGKGNRRPQLDINIELIQVDQENPRLVPYLENPEEASQLDLISVLYENFDTEAVALSLVENGYFDEEPIVVVPNKIPSTFVFADYPNPDKLAQALKGLIDNNTINFTVVEGNRRTSAIKLITDLSLRKQLGIDRFYPKTDDQLKISDISNIPCIIYEKREDVSSYLGVRHIAGLLKWEAFAQAAYTASVIEQELKKGHSIAESIKQVQKVVGDRSDKLRKQYITYKLFLEAKDNLNFNVRPIINSFSLLTVAYNSASIREYLGVEAYSKVDLDSELITSEKSDNFKNVLTWIYGNLDTSEQPVLTDSRKITNTLSHVVKKEESIEYLLKYRDLDGAYERTNGEREYLSKKLTDASRAMQESLKFAFRHKNDDELIKQVTELEELIVALKSNLL